MNCLLRFVLFCRTPLVVWSQVGVTNLGDDWYNLPTAPGPTGDYTQPELDKIRKYDVGVNGGEAAVVNWGDWESELKKNGDKPLPTFKIMGPDEWAKKEHVKIVDGTPKDIYGTKMVLTSEGYKPEHQSSYRAAWNLQDKPRRIALIVEDMVEDYRIWIGYLIPKIAPLIKAFKDAEMLVLWSNWLRRPNDKLYGALDRFYGSKGVKTAENGAYIYGEKGAFPMKEIAPADEDVAAGFMIHSAHLSKFADVTDGGKSYLRELLGKHGIDTLVMTGAWSEDCIIATVYDAVDTENLDVVVVSDAVGTATPGQGPALEVMKYSVAKMMTAEQVLNYVEDHKGDEKYILKAEVVPQIFRFSSPSAVHKIIITMSLPQLVLLLSVVIISTLAISFAVQRTLARMAKKNYVTLDESSEEQPESVAA